MKNRISGTRNAPWKGTPIHYLSVISFSVFTQRAQNEGKMPQKLFLRMGITCGRADRDGLIGPILMVLKQEEKW
jgi:hypothetical protein